MGFAAPDGSPIFVSAEKIRREFDQGSQRAVAALRGAVLDGTVHIIASQGETVRYPDNNQSIASQLGFASLRVVEEVA
jgi:hypothetical protein